MLVAARTQVLDYCHSLRIVGAEGRFAVHLTDLTDFSPLTTGRVVAHYLSGTQTRRIGPLVDQYPVPRVEVHPARCVDAHDPTAQVLVGSFGSTPQDLNELIDLQSVRLAGCATRFPWRKRFDLKQLDGSAGKLAVRFAWQQPIGAVPAGNWPRDPARGDRVDAPPRRRPSARIARAGCARRAPGPAAARRPGR